jgi:hypothetical protein
MTERSGTTGQPAPGSKTHKRPPAEQGGNDQLKKNRQQLGVGSDHKTEAMKKHRRGTYP